MNKGGGQLDKIKYDYSKLRQRIKDRNYSLTSFSKALGMSRTSLYMRLSNQSKQGFSQEEMSLVAKLLGISLREIPAYFFKTSVQKNVHRCNGKR